MRFGSKSAAGSESAAGSAGAFFPPLRHLALDNSIVINASGQRVSGTLSIGEAMGGRVSGVRYPFPGATNYDPMGRVPVSDGLLTL